MRGAFGHLRGAHTFAVGPTPLLSVTIRGIGVTLSSCDADARQSCRLTPTALLLEALQRHHFHNATFHNATHSLCRNRKAA